MENYRSTEQESTSKITARLGPPDYFLASKMGLRSRRYANRLEYDEGEILDIAENRIRFSEAASGGLFEWLCELSRKLRGVQTRERTLKVSGHELHTLHSLVGQQVKEPITPADEYDVRFDYCKGWLPWHGGRKGPIGVVCAPFCS